MMPFKSLLAIACVYSYRALPDTTYDAHTRTHMHMHMHMHMHTHTYTHTHTHARAHPHAQAHTYTRTHARTRSYIPSIIRDEYTLYPCPPLPR